MSSNTAARQSPRYMKRRRLLIGRGQWRGLTPSLGAQRRLRALAALGWSWHACAEQVGMEKRFVQRLAAGDRATVHPATHDRIAALYERLSMTVGPSPRTRAYAQRHGWLPPLAWDDADLDDPAAAPHMPTGGRPDLAPCGTEAAAKRHRRRGEPIDPACRAAEARAKAERRAA